MSTLTYGATLLEMAKRIAPDGSQMTIAEIMTLENAMLRDIPWVSANDIWSHKSLRRASQPAGSWRGMNEYVAPEKTTTDEIMDVIGIIEGFSVADKLWIDRQPNPGMARMGNATAFLEGMARTLGSAFLYGNTNVTPKTPHGLAPRIATLGRYAVGGSGTGSDVTSVYVVTWGRGACYGIYPKTGTGPSGEFLIQHTDLGVLVDTNTAGAKLVTYQDNFKFEGGLVVEDPRCLGRYANIETAGSSNLFDEDNLIRLINRMKTGPGTAIYANETIKTQMDILAKDKNNIRFTINTVLSGEPVTSFLGIPIRKIDSQILLDTEDAIA